MVLFRMNVISHQIMHRSLYRDAREPSVKREQGVA